MVNDCYYTATGSNRSNNLEQKHGSHYGDNCVVSSGVSIDRILVMGSVMIRLRMNGSEYTDNDQYEQEQPETLYYRQSGHQGQVTRHSPVASLQE